MLLKVGFEQERGRENTCFPVEEGSGTLETVGFQKRAKCLPEGRSKRACEIPTFKW